MAKAVRGAKGAQVLRFFKEHVVRHFGWPRASYSDNGRQFVFGDFPNEMKRQGVHMMYSPPGKPSSVGLAERYVRLVKEGLQKAVQDDPRLIWQWDTILDEVVNNINTRSVRYQGYTAAELRFGFVPRFGSGLPNINDVMAKTVLRMCVDAGKERDIAEVGAMNHEIKMAALEEIRDTAIKRRMHQQEAVANKDTAIWKLPHLGDLVCLRAHALDTQKGKKLQPRWLGPYKLVKISKNGRSDIVHDIHTEQTVGRYHLNHLKVYILRANYIPPGRDWKRLTQLSKDAYKMWKKCPKEPNESEKTSSSSSEDKSVDEKLLDVGQPPGNWLKTVTADMEECEERDAGYWEAKACNLRCAL